MHIHIQCTYTYPRGPMRPIVITKTTDMYAHSHKQDLFSSEVCTHTCNHADACMQAFMYMIGYVSVTWCK